MNFVIYENAEPILKEHTADKAVEILLKRHEDFDEDTIKEVVSLLVPVAPYLIEPDAMYGAYVTAVVTCRQVERLKTNIT